MAMWHLKGGLRSRAADQLRTVFDPSLYLLFFENVGYRFSMRSVWRCRPRRRSGNEVSTSFS